MTSQFQGELHKLCEEAKWDSVKSLLLSWAGVVTTDPTPTTTTVPSTSTTNGELDHHTAEEEEENNVDKMSIKAKHNHLIKTLTTREGWNQWTPLMISCVRAPPTILTLLIQFSPQSCLIPDRSGSLPIHFVVCWRRGDDVEEVIRALVEARPECLGVKNMWGMTPVHSAFDGRVTLEYGCVLALFGILVDDTSYIEEEEEEETTTVTTTDTNTHYSTTSPYNKYVRAALSHRDSKRRLPLHIAASSGAEEDTLRLLTLHYGDAALECDGDGDLPIHLLQNYAVEAANPNHEVEGLGSGSGNNKDYFGAVHGVDLGCVECLLEPIVFFQNDKEKEEENINGGIKENKRGWNPPFLKNVPKTKVELDIQTERAALSYRAWLQEQEKLKEEEELDEEDDYNKEYHQNENEEEEEKSEIVETYLQKQKLQQNPKEEPYLTKAEKAARTFGSHNSGLPLHIAAEHAVSLPILSKLCELYPAGASIPRRIYTGTTPDPKNKEEEKEEEKEATTNLYPIELFESGRAGIQAATTAHTHQNLLLQSQKGTLTDPSLILTSKEKFASLLQNFVERLDLLFAYFPEAVPSNLGQRIPGTKDCRILLYRKDPARIGRLEELVRKEALDLGERKKLSEMVRRVWLFFTTFHPPPPLSEEEKKEENYGSNVGRILSALPPPSLWKLSIIPNKSHGISALDSGYLFIRTPSGKTLYQESEERNPNTTMTTLLKNPNIGWQFVLTSFLNAVDALSYSVCCRRTRAAGVRLLREMNVKVPHGQWEFKHDGGSGGGNGGHCKPKPWQRIELFVTPECTHSMFVTYRLLVRGPLENNNNHNNNHSKSENGSETSSTQTDPRKRTKQEKKLPGGLLVVRDDDRRLRPNNTSPWGTAVVSSHQTILTTSSSTPRTGIEVRLHLQHQRGHTYGLWYYGPQGGGLSVTDVRVRQLVHASDIRNRTPLHVLLSGGDPGMHLGTQMKMLLEAKFGSDRPGDSIGDVPLHFALKCGASEEVLRALIAENPGCLLETDREGRTPLHAAFLLCSKGSPEMGVIKALLVTPGENATKLKDTSGRLPLHIAAERGAGEDVLKLLVASYADGCYRQNTNGDLPIHLLVRSGAATTESVELLITPIMESETICRIPGSGRRVNMPLHIASEYLCSYGVLEKLLLSYKEAASIPRIEAGEEVVRDFPLDIYEKSKENFAPSSMLRRYSASTASTENHRLRKSSYDDSNVPKGGPEWERAKLDVVIADLNMRSDLLFVHNPKLVSSITGEPYRREQRRIERLQNLIRREAIHCSEKKSMHQNVEMHMVAKLAWCWMCTFTNPNDKNDHYAQSVRIILSGLSTAAVQFLADVEYEKSEPVPNQPIKDCATPLCAAIIQSRIRFVGRYVLHDEMFPLHKSDSCLVMKARDYGAAGEFARIQNLLNEEEPDIDELAETGSLAPGSSKNVVASKGCILMKDFIVFARKLGVDERLAKKEIKRYPKELKNELLDDGDGDADEDGEMSTLGPIHTIEEDESYDEGDEEATYTGKSNRRKTSEITMEAFYGFCTAYGLADDGSRNVVIKFMMHRHQFHREKSSRSQLNLVGTKWPVAPILEEYDIDRMSKMKDVDWSRDDSSTLLDNKDAQYAQDILEKNASIHNFSLYKYAVVLPCADRDLAEICMHEELGILQIREYILQVAMSLKCLHSKSVIHGDLKMANVVRFGKDLALTDLDSSSPFSQRRAVTTDETWHMGGGSHKLSSGILPPEMIAKIDLATNYDQLVQYELYWRHVSDDAKDLKLLTPDDIQTITSVVKSLLAKSDPARPVVSTPSAMRDAMGETLAGLENPSSDWKDIITMALVTISYEDLPFSLTCSESLEEFAQIWSRLQVNYRLWEKIRPRISADGSSAYIIKTFNDLPTENRKIMNEDDIQENCDEVDISMLPYDLVTSNEKIDIWAFGVLLYSLCSGGNLFPMDLNGDLQDVDAYKKLFSWNKKTAEKMLNENVEDPLAHDLLMHLLVPQKSRLANMDTVLRHPFFGPSSALEAQRILEKHEEQQLMLEETIIVTRMTTATQRRIENSMEKHIKVVFDEERVVVPTCLVVLPYKLEWNEADKAMVTPNELNCVGLAVQIGKHLLDINKATARLSFWLMMKKNLADKSGGQFKTQMKSWLKRARSEPCDAIAKEIVDAIGCGPEYMNLCMEMLEKGDSISNARAYIKEPMGAARAAMREHIHALVQCYSSQWLYLVDEVFGVPVVSGDGLNPGDMNEETPYPILIDPSSHLLQGLFLPFMNITVMSVTAIDRCKGVARLLGIPSSYGVPDSWKETEPGLVHRIEKPSSVAEFAVLHDVIRKQERKAAMRASTRLKNSAANGIGGLDHKDFENLSVTTGSRSGMDSSVGSSTMGSNTIDKAFEMMQLEVFFREYDPMRIFSDLRRVTDGKENSPAMWTTDAVVAKIQSEVELAGVEMRLRELKKEWDRRDKLQQEIITLTNRVKEIRYPGRKGRTDRALPRTSLTRSGTQESAEIQGQTPVERREMGTAPGMNAPAQFQPPYTNDYTNPNASALRRQSSATSVGSSKRKKMRKTKEKAAQRMFSLR